LHGIYKAGKHDAKQKKLYFFEHNDKLGKGIEAFVMSRMPDRKYINETMLRVLQKKSYPIKDSYVPSKGLEPSQPCDY
jgi:hypothetical protein